jgi:DNA-binding MarR family transcriptional regulator
MASTTSRHITHMLRPTTELAALEILAVLHSAGGHLRRAELMRTTASIQDPRATIAVLIKEDWVRRTDRAPGRSPLFAIDEVGLRALRALVTRFHPLALRARRCAAPRPGNMSGVGLPTLRTHAAIDVLATLCEVGHAMTTGQIADTCELSRPSATSTMNMLRKRGLIRAEVIPGHLSGGPFQLMPTPQGRRVLRSTAETLLRTTRPLIEELDIALEAAPSTPRPQLVHRRRTTSRIPSPPSLRPAPITAKRLWLLTHLHATPHGAGTLDDTSLGGVVWAPRVHQWLIDLQRWGLVRPADGGARSRSERWVATRSGTLLLGTTTSTMLHGLEAALPWLPGSLHPVRDATHLRDADVACTPTQFEVLALACRARGVSTVALADHLDIDQRAAGRRISRLHNEGFLELRPGTDSAHVATPEATERVARAARQYLPTLIVASHNVARRLTTSDPLAGRLQAQSASTQALLRQRLSRSAPPPGPTL